MACAGCLPPGRSLRAQHVSFAIAAADTLAQAHFSRHPVALGTE